MAAVSRLAWGILVLGLTGALANVFLPQSNVWGIDIGSLGATVFGFTLWTGAWLFARYPDRIFSPDWSVAERRAWTALVFIGLDFSLLSAVHVACALDVRRAGRNPGVAGGSLHLEPDGAVHRVGSGIGEHPGTRRGRRRIGRTRPAAAPCGGSRRATGRSRSSSCGASACWSVSPPNGSTWWLAPLIAANVLIGILIGKTFVEHVYLVARYAWDRR